MKKKPIVISLAVLAFLAALGLTLYPMIAAKYNEAHQSKVLIDYRESVDRKDDSEKEYILESARRYNEALHSGVTRANAQSTTATAFEEYSKQLDVLGNGIMGYIRIPAIGINLPVFHGSDDKTLAQGVGHLFGSSLPVGGAGTHAVLTGHSGMASQRMFSDLADMKTGDVFFIDVLGERLAYKVRQINVVLPHDASLLEIVPDEDLCTLVTCTPYGVNTHRLLVQGSRIPYEDAEENITLNETAPMRSTWERQYAKGICAGVIVAVALGTAIFVVRMIRRKRHE